MNPLSIRLNRCALRRKLSVSCGWLALAAGAGSSAATAHGQCSPKERAKLIASDAAALDKFGSSVALDGDTAVVGARGDDDGGQFSGSAYVFVYSAGAWTEQAKLTATDAAANDEFGSSAALSGDTVVIGASGDDDAGGSSGSAYVFVRADGVWTQQAKLTASDGQANAAFGSSVAMFGDTAVIGAWGDDNAGGFQAGSAYVFVRSGSVWIQQSKLTASDAAAQNYFGSSTAVSGDTAVVGAFADDHAGGTGAGSAYVFVRAGAVWTEQAKLTASDAATDDWFGRSVALSGDTVVVAALHDDHAGATDAGSAYVFTRLGNAWTQKARLTASDAAAGDEFGVSVALSDDTVVVGANLDDHPGGIDAGAAYVFVKPGSGWTTTTETAQLIATDAEVYDNFGISVAVSGATTLVGADLAVGIDAGAAYIIECTIPGCPVAITASDAAAGDEFGISVAIDGDTALVGARQDDNATGVDAGSAYVYARSGPPGSEVWTAQAKLIGTNVNGGYTGSQSGISVAISGDTAIVGSWLWPNVQAIGAAYVFVRSGQPGNEVWTQQAFLTNTGFFGAYQYFGYSVALEGDTALIGGLQQPGLNVAGLAIFFQRTGPAGGENWIADGVQPSDAVVDDQFGNSVAMSPSQDTGIVGAWYDDNAGGVDAGSAYIFTRTGTVNNPDWVQQAKLTASDAAPSDNFGVKVAISGNTAVVGAFQDDHEGGVNAGSVYIFTRVGTVWTQQAKLTASDAAAGDYFGISLAFSGDSLAIGAHGDDHPGAIDAGSTYVFTRSGPPGNEVWNQDFKLTSPTPGAEDWFGAAVALSGDTPVIGARQNDHAIEVNAGSAHIFNLNCEAAVCCTGDFDASSAVTLDDVSAFVDALLADVACPAAPDCCPGDFNLDGLMNGGDVSGFVIKLLEGGACP